MSVADPSVRIDCFNGTETRKTSPRDSILDGQAVVIGEVSFS